MKIGITKEGKQSFLKLYLFGKLRFGCSLYNVVGRVAELLIAANMN